MNITNIVRHLHQSPKRSAIMQFEPVGSTYGRAFGEPLDPAQSPKESPVGCLCRSRSTIIITASKDASLQLRRGGYGDGRWQGSAAACQSGMPETEGRLLRNLPGSTERCKAESPESSARSEGAKVGLLRPELAVESVRLPLPCLQVDDLVAKADLAAIAE